MLLRRTCRAFPPRPHAVVLGYRDLVLESELTPDWCTVMIWTVWLLACDQAPARPSHAPSRQAGVPSVGPVGPCGQSRRDWTARPTPVWDDASRGAGGPRPVP